MKHFFISFLLIAVIGNFSYGQNSLPKNIAGVYQWCLVRCETVKINNDFTFEFIFEREGQYKGYMKGKWEIIEQNKMKLVAQDKVRIKEFEEIAKNGVFIEPAYPTEIDETFVIKKKKICKLINADVYSCYKKLSNKESKRLFPK